MKKNNIIELENILKELSSITYDIFLQIKKIRFSIKNKSEVITETKKLEQLFNKFSTVETIENKLFFNFNDKTNSFSNAVKINKSRQLSRGTFSFFEYVYNNPTYYGEIESYLSKVRNKCEVSWYGILQAYGKVIISAI